MFPSLVVALFFLLAVLSHPLTPARKTCVIADVDYPNPHDALLLLGRQAIDPPFGLSKRTFADLLIWCHEHGQYTDRLLARENPSCPSGNRTTVAPSSASSTVSRPRSTASNVISSSTPNRGPATSSSHSFSRAIPTTSAAIRTPPTISTTLAGPHSTASNVIPSSAPSRGPATSSSHSFSRAIPTTSAAIRTPLTISATLASPHSTLTLGSSLRGSGSATTFSSGGLSKALSSAVPTSTTAIPNLTRLPTTTMISATPTVACPSGYIASVALSGTVNGVAEVAVCIAL